MQNGERGPGAPRPILRMPRQPDKRTARWPACLATPAPRRAVTHALLATPVTLGCCVPPAQPFRTPRPAMTHVQRLWLLCLAYASATATTPTFGNAQTIVPDMARKAQLLGVLLRLGGAWAFPSRNGVNNHQNWGANPQALAAIQSTDGSIACWGHSEYGGGGCPTDTGYQALYSSGILLVVALAVHLAWLHGLSMLAN